MTGTWLGEETLLSTPWDPAGGTAIGRTQARPGVGGQVVTADYAEERDGIVVFRAHGVYAWDAATATYCMYWFDSMQPCPVVLPARGSWYGSVLAFEITGEATDYRYVYDFRAPGVYDFTIQVRPAGEAWITAMRGAYVRQ